MKYVIFLLITIMVASTAIADRPKHYEPTEDVRYYEFSVSIDPDLIDELNDLECVYMAIYRGEFIRVQYRQWEAEACEPSVLDVFDSYGILNKRVPFSK